MKNNWYNLKKKIPIRKRYQHIMNDLQSELFYAIRRRPALILHRFFLK